MVFLAVNIGLSLPSKAAHQLPWLPSVCVRVKEREKGEKKEEHHVSKIKARFHACFWPSWVFAFPSYFHPFFPPACSRAADALRIPQQFPPTLSGPDPTFAEIRCFYREMEAKTFFSGFLWKYSVACRLLGQSSAPMMTIRETIFE